MARKRHKSHPKLQKRSDRALLPWRIKLPSRSHNTGFCSHCANSGTSSKIAHKRALSTQKTSPQNLERLHLTLALASSNSETHTHTLQHWAQWQARMGMSERATHKIASYPQNAQKQTNTHTHTTDLLGAIILVLFGPARDKQT